MLFVRCTCMCRDEHPSIPVHEFLVSLKHTKCSFLFPAVISPLLWVRRSYKSLNFNNNIIVSQNLLTQEFSLFQLRTLVYKCIQPEPTERPDIKKVYEVGKAMHTTFFSTYKSTVTTHQIFCQRRQRKRGNGFG